MFAKVRISENNTKQISTFFVFIVEREWFRDEVSKVHNNSDTTKRHKEKCKNNKGAEEFTSNLAPTSAFLRHPSQKNYIANTDTA